MPRLSKNPELLRAARLARVGPETWDSWKKAGQAPLDLLKSLVSDAPVGTLLRSLGVDLPKQKNDIKALEDYVLDLGIPQVPVGQIKRLSHALRKGSPEAQKLRKVMREESRSRGVQDKKDYLDSLLRSTPFHGSEYEHYPQTGEVYNPGIPKPGNIGEPQGLSLTYLEPRKFVSEHSSFAKKPKKYGEALKRLEEAKGKLPYAYDREKLRAEKKGLEKSRDFLQRKTEEPVPMSRVFPRFHGRPTEKVIKGWQGGGDELVLQEAYTYALKQMPGLWRWTGAGDEVANSLLPSYQGIKATMKGPMKQTFNIHLTDYLRSKGYRGILYSPQRYGEYELRMLDPRDVVQQDIRKVDDPGLERMYAKKEGTPEWDTSQKTLPKKAQAIKVWDKVSTKQANPYSTKGHQPYALGAIYKDIDLSSLRLESPELRNAAREQVRIGVLSQEERTLADKLSVGKLGESRIHTDIATDPAMLNSPWDKGEEVLDKFFDLPLKIKKKSKKKISLGTD